MIRTVPLACPEPSVREATHGRPLAASGRLPRVTPPRITEPNKLPTHKSASRRPRTPIATPSLPLPPNADRLRKRPSPLKLGRHGRACALALRARQTPRVLPLELHQQGLLAPAADPRAMQLLLLPLQSPLAQRRQSSLRAPLALVFNAAGISPNRLATSPP